MAARTDLLRPYLSLLGGFALVAGAEEIPLGASKNYALLAFLTVDGRARYTRAYLADLLWPNVSHRRARHSLSQALYSIGQVLGSPLWKLTQGTVSVERDRLDVDAVHLRERLQVGDYLGAASLYQGSFLDGLDIVDAVNFQQWRDARAAELEAHGLRALRGCLTGLETAGRWAEISRFTAQILAIDSYDLTAHTVRIKSLLMLGQREQAAFELERFVQEWEVNIGEPPGDEIARLRSLIQEGWEAPARFISGRSEPERPFVGRGDQLRELRAAWTDAKDGSGRALFVLGAPGVGKSRLCRQFMHFVCASGARVVAGRCHAAEVRSPYSGLAELLTDAVQPQDLRDLEPVWRHTLCYVFPEFGEEIEGGPAMAPDDGSRRRIFEAVARCFRAMSQSGPLVVFLDDVHWADESTLATLQYAARRLAKDPIIFLIAGRIGYTAGSDSQRGRSLSSGEYIGEPWRALRLDELQPDHALSLVASAFESCSDVDWAQASPLILEYGGGNPYCLLHLANAYAAGKFHPPDGNREVNSHLQASPPPEVERFLTSQFETLSRSGLRVLGALAVLQRPAPLRDLAATSGLSELDAADALVELSQRSWILTADPEIEFSHGLVRDVAYRHLQPSTRRALHLSAGRTLSRHSHPRPSVLARHFDLAGEAFLGRIWAMRAAKESISVTALEDAEYFLRVAASNTPGLFRGIVAEKRLAQFLIMRRKWEEAHALWKHLKQWAESHGAHRLETIASAHTIMHEVRCGGLDAALAFDRLDELLGLCDPNADAAIESVWDAMADAAEILGSSEKALSVARRMIAQANHAPARPSAIRLRVVGLAFELLFGDFNHAFNEFSILLEEAAKNERPLRDQLMIRMRYGYALLLSGNAVSAIEEIAAVDRTMEEKGMSTPSIKNNLGVACMEVGMYARAYSAFAEAQAALELEPDAATEVYVLCNLCELYFVQGYFAEAAGFAERVLDVARGAGSRWSLCQAWAFLGLIALAQGRFADAREQYIHLRTAYHDGILGHPHVVIFLARMEMLGGDIASGRQRLTGATERRIEYGASPYGRLRLELEHARTFLEDDGEHAAVLARGIRRRAMECSARPIVEEVDILLERIAAREAM